ncbi:haloacid dehalogenase type II [Undibacterium oligocarboniphilum]|uniref:(S)-2-haloacid dehalogenase n=1 Tax=Undibacterium oligocarboniphilum TaxID=666702 RepID=A0A850QTF9_9BURK|nr:haloacid dehalogenase type II [Undibacterium oligocarboniphilum]MBC3871205.1 haloacid dehalogenase type II [Undibacterium oligocarboniphilum]NVO79296.1 haloacid dehalogenase type II [Undibacterium oligocarboniphilum]
MSIQAIAFDAYGTLFDVYSVNVLGDKLFPGRGEALAQLWRSKQIEYTQLRTMCSMYKPFWEVTQDALVFSCKKLGLELSLEAQNALMGEYARLKAFPENLAVLRDLHAQGLKLSILSNGTSHMLQSAVEAAGMQGLFSHLLSVDSVRKYKTAPEAYQLGPDTFGVPAKQILFVSSNAWDVCCATWFGYTTFWVNRQQAPLEELGVAPHGTGRTLQDVIDFVEKNRY